MNRLKEYLWLVETIRRHGKISLRELSDEWERNKDISDYKPLQRGTFNRWRDAIRAKLGIDIQCQRADGNKYYIANTEDINDDKLKQWLLDTFACGNLVEENLSLKNRIIIDEIPSGRLYLTPIMEAMKRNKLIKIAYRSFNTYNLQTYTLKPYCVKLFAGRWYLLAVPTDQKNFQTFGLDRIENLTILNESFKLPEHFSASEYFELRYGIVMEDVKPERIIIRAHSQHKHYIQSLPLHHSQRLLENHPEYADFELYLAPTFDFIMRLLHDGAWIEVISPTSLRQAIKGWITDMYDLYDEG